MTALSAERNRYIRDEHLEDLFGTVLLADSITLWKGGIACANGAGRVAVGADSANFKVAGVVRETRTSGASNSTVYADLVRGHTEWFPHDGGITAAMVGKNATLLDDNTLSVSATTTQDIPVGEIVELQTINGQAGAWVRIGVYATTTA